MDQRPDSQGSGPPEADEAQNRSPIPPEQWEIVRVSDPTEYLSRGDGIVYLTEEEEARYLAEQKAKQQSESE